jgi:hypothetical protein
MCGVRTVPHGHGAQRPWWHVVSHVRPRVCAAGPDHVVSPPPPPNSPLLAPGSMLAEDAIKAAVKDFKSKKAKATATVA